MPKRTGRLNLHKWDTTNATDLESQFNIDKSLNENWDKIDEAVGDLQDKAELNAVDIDTNKTDIATHQTKITALEGDNTTNKANISALKTDNTKNKSDIAKAKSDISTLQTDNTNNKSKITSLETDNTTNKADIAKLKTDTSKNTADITKAKVDITKLENDNTTNKENIEANQTAIATQKTKVESLEADNITNKSDISKLKTDTANLQDDKVDKEDGKSLMSDTEIERLKNVDNYNDTAVKQDISNIQSEQVTQNEAIAEIQQKDVAQDESIELLKQENIEMKQENTELKAECERLREDANSLPTVQAEGENIMLEGTAEARFKKFSICGNSKQEVASIENGDEYDSPSLEHSSEIKTLKDNVNETVCNKNLFDKNNYILFQGSVGNNNILNQADMRHKWVVFPIAGNMNISSYAKLVSGNSGQIICLSKLPQVGDEILNRADYPNYTSIKTHSDTRYVMVYLGASYNENWTSIEDLVNYVMVAETTEKLTESDYVEHKEQSFTIPLQQDFRKVDAVADTFVKKDGKRYERHWIKRFIVDGVTNKLSKMSVKDNYTTFDFETNLNLFGMTDYWGTPDKALCSHFKQVSLGHIESGNSKYLYHFAVWGASLRFSFEKDKFATVDEANNFLKELYDNNNALYVDVILKEPLDIECTDAQKAVLNEIEKTVKSYKDVTHIFSTDEISPIVHVEAKKDMQAEIDNLKQAIVALGGV